MAFWVVTVVVCCCFKTFTTKSQIVFKLFLNALQTEVSLVLIVVYFEVEIFIRLTWEEIESISLKKGCEYSDFKGLYKLEIQTYGQV